MDGQKPACIAPPLVGARPTKHSAGKQEGASMGMANWWDEVVVPRLVKLGGSTEAIMDLRRQVVPLASGNVFELGCGGGINQLLLDREKVSSYAGLDPSAKGLDYARQSAVEMGWQADIRQGFGENLPFADNSFDTVVCTLTLCTVGDHARTLSEIRRVLRPGGTYLFAEHGRAPDERVARFQERVDPLWKRVFGGCHTSRPVSPAIESAGFAVDRMGASYREKGPKFVGWFEWGAARKLG
jgi:ubiquinone/menaquinone biosynthesis C-methylase UbiE